MALTSITRQKRSASTPTSKEDTLTIVDVTNKAAPAMLSRTGYSGSRYTHQGWLTEDHAYFLLDDELDEANNPAVTNTRTYLWDVSNLDDPVLIGVHDSTTTATDHNQYVKGNYTYQSNYQAGLRILNITDIANGNLSEEAFFDIYPGSDSPGFNGSWSNYPFFDSGIVLVSGIEQGLFILRPNLKPRLNSATVDSHTLTLTYGSALDESSTPATDAFTVTVAGSRRTVTHVSVSGRVVTLTLASAVTDSQEVTVTYTVPVTNPIRDSAGNEADGLSNELVEKATPPPPLPPPPPPPSPPRRGGGGGGGAPACARDGHGNQATQATDLELSTVTAGTICPAEDVDYFTVIAPGRGHRLCGHYRQRADPRHDLATRGGRGGQHSEWTAGRAAGGSR